MVIAPFVARFALVAGALGTLAATAACGPGNSCEIYLTCPTSSAGTGGATGGGGAAGGGGAGGGTGGTAPSCGDGIVQPGEVCFTAPALDYPTQGQEGRDLVLVDCDDDGDLDAVVINASDGLVALRNDTSGAFDEAVVTEAYPSVDLAVAERGGAFEIAALSEVAARVHWYGGHPTIPCGFQETYGLSLAGTPVAVAYLDANGNDIPDTVKVVHYESSTTVAVEVDHGASSSSYTSWDMFGEAPAAAVASGDFAGSSLHDVLLALPGDPILRLHTNLGSDSFSVSPTSVPPGGVGSPPARIAVSDLNRDGAADVVTVNPDSRSIAILLSLGSASFSAQTPEPTIDNSEFTPRALAVGDIDGDGDLDVITANSSDRPGAGLVSIFLNDGSAKFGLAAGAPIVIGESPVAIQLGDVNQDGALDIITIGSHVDGGSSRVSVILAQP